MNKYPVSLEEFKLFFMRDAGIEYQPYPTWVKTVWDTGDWCYLDHVFYKSLVDLNHTMPTVETEQPMWAPGNYIYVEGASYEKGNIVYYEGTYYIALEATETAPGSDKTWALVDLCCAFPKARPWAEPTAYNTDAEVVAIINYKPVVMKSNIDGNYTDPSVQTPVPELPEDTPYQVYCWEEDEEETANLADCILDSDILRAMEEASFKFNKSLSLEDKGKMIFLYLTMFFLVYDRQMAASGLNGNSASGPVIHRTVGKMSVSYMESKLFSKYPSYEFLASNDYGRKAFNLMRPYLTGGVRILMGASTVQ